MDEQKKPKGRPQIYQGWNSEPMNRRRGRPAGMPAQKPAQRAQEEKRVGVYRPLKVTEQQVAETKPMEKMKPAAEVRQESEGKPMTEVISAAEVKAVAEVIPESEEKSVAGVIPESEGKPVAGVIPESEGKPVAEAVREAEPKPVTEVKSEKVVQLQRPRSVTEQKAAQRPRPVTEQKAAQPSRQAAPQKPVQNPRVSQVNKEKELAVKRRREQENEAKLKTLWGMLGILTVILIAAIIYEIILGHGIKETGSERIAAQQEEELILDTENYNIEILTPGEDAASWEQNRMEALQQETVPEAESEK